MVAGEDAAVAETGDGRERSARSPVSSRGSSEVGGGRLRVGAAGRQAEDRRPADPGQPEHRAGMGRHAVPDDPAAEPLDRHEERVDRVGAAAAGGQDDVGAGRASPRASAARAAGHRVVVVGHVGDPASVEPSALDLVPGRSPRTARRAGARSDSLTTTADPHRPERRDPRRADRGADAGDPRAALDDATPSTTCGATLTLATRSPARDDRPSNTREDLERVDPVEALERARRGRGRRPSCAASRSTRLSAGPRTIRPGPATAAARRRAASSSWSVAGLENDQGDPGRQAARTAFDADPGRRRYAARSAGDRAGGP